MKQIKKNVSPMSNEGRNTYVIEHITEAMFKLLEEKEIMDISVSELCGRAGIGRASFYRNFETKEHIIKTYIGQLFTNEVRIKEGDLVSDVIRLIFMHFDKHRDLYETLNKRGLIYLLKDMIIEEYKLDVNCPKEEAYAKAFAVYSLYGWIEVWFQRGMKETADEMAEMFKKQGV